MLSIDNKRIRSLSAHLPTSLEGKEVLLAVEVASNARAAQNAGFGPSPAPGDTILPKPLGSVTRFNAWGREIIQRDQPKETRYRTQEWTHQEWRGKETVTVTSLVDVPYQRYPREVVAAMGIELTVVKKQGHQFITPADRLVYDPANPETLLTAINIFLEVFGHVEVYDEAFEPVEIRRLNWHLLPPGKKVTIDELTKELEDILSKSKRIRPVEILRQDRIIGFEPTTIAYGTGGFTGYVAYVFPEKGITVLESIRYGNASYVLDATSWEDLSKLTKQELLSKKLVNDRLIHTTKWFSLVKDVLEKK